MGIGPVSWFSPSNNCSRLTRPPSSVGIGPVNWFKERSSRFRLTRPPSSVGIGPVNWFLHKDSSSRLTRPPSSVGIGPVNRFSVSDSAVTRRGLPPTVTPSQSAMGIFADQLSGALPTRARRAASSALQSDTSPGLLVASTTAVPVAQSLVVTRVGVPVTVVDQCPVLKPLTARTCTSYWAPSANAAMVYSSAPPVAAVHMSSTTVQLDSTVSSTAVCTWRRS